MKTVAFHNLGCKVNDYEMDIMQQKFAENDFCVVPFDQKADIYVINTCTVTNIADRKSRQMLHRAKKENPDSIVIAVGCYVQTSTEQVLSDLSVDIAIGNNKKSEIIEILKEYLEKNRPESFGKILDINHTNEYESMFLSETADRTRAYIKIQDGCNQFCTYCLIPYARGRVRSRDMDEIVKEATALSLKGYREIVLTGIHISSYGITDPNDLSQNRLADLIENLAKIPTLKRIRLSSLEPRVVTEEFAERISKIDKLCPHFHLSLQSGCEATLKRMNRHYTASEYKEGVKILRKFFEDPAITTDVIAGFPGESEEEFKESFNFVRDICFYETHIFKFSRRKGTVADKLPGQLTDAVKSARSHRLIELSKENASAFRALYKGRVRSVLFEEKENVNGVEYFVGFTPEYIKVAVKTNEDLSGKICDVKLKDFLTEEILEGESEAF